MYEFGTTPEQMAYGCAVIRNCATVNPDAVMFGRGPYTADDVLGSRMIADPFTLLMCSLVNDGGSCVVVTTAERARDCRHQPVWLVGGAMEQRYTSYYEVPTLEPMQTRRRMVQAFVRAGIDHAAVDQVSLYDHFASGIIMELETLGFCQPGEGGPFVTDRAGFDGLPLSTDGGCLAHSHPGNPYNMKIIESVRQLRNQVRDLLPVRRARGPHLRSPAVPEGPSPTDRRGRRADDRRVLVRPPGRRCSGLRPDRRRRWRRRTTSMTTSCCRRSSGRASPRANSASSTAAIVAGSAFPRAVSARTAMGCGSTGSRLRVRRPSGPTPSSIGRRLPNGPPTCPTPSSSASSAKDPSSWPDSARFRPGPVTIGLPIVLGFHTGPDGVARYHFLPTGRRAGPGEPAG